MSNAITTYKGGSTDLPTPEDWKLMVDMASALVPTGFLPESIKNPPQAVAVMLKGRELGVPPMYALSNIVIVKGKPTVSAEMMLALIYRDHGKQAIRIKESTNQFCTIEYRLPGWDVTAYTFTIEDATKAGLTRNNTWSQYPAAMLRARCISAVARMAFPESIAGMYSPGELGEAVVVNDDGEVVSQSTVEISAETPMGQNIPLSAYSIDEVMTGYDRQGNNIEQMVERSARTQSRQNRPARTEVVEEASGDPMAALHAEGAKHGIEHEAFSAWAKANFPVDSLAKVDPPLLGRLTKRLKEDPAFAEEFRGKYQPVEDAGVTEAEYTEVDPTEAPTATPMEIDGMDELNAEADKVQAAARARA